MDSIMTVPLAPFQWRYAAQAANWWLSLALKVPYCCHTTSNDGIGHTLAGAAPSEYRPAIQSYSSLSGAFALASE